MDEALQQISKQPTKHPKKVTAVNTFAYIFGTLGNIAVIPQIIKAWEGPAPGLSVLTWILFIGVSGTWLAYGIVHKQTPLIVAQIVGVTFNIAVVIGWIVHN